MAYHREQINVSSASLTAENFGSFKICTSLKVPTLLPIQMACFVCRAMQMYSITVTHFGLLILFIYFLHSLDPLQGRDHLDVEIVNVTKNLTKF